MPVNPLPSPSKARTAFTLVELLVVIAIIAILAAIAIPAATGALNSSRKAKCMSNLRALGAASAGYMADNNGIMTPPFNGNAANGLPVNGVNWMAPLTNYIPMGRNAQNFPPLRGGLVNSVFSCPARATKGDNKASYGLNSGIYNSNWLARFVRIPEPSKIIHIADMMEMNTEAVLTADGRNVAFNARAGANEMAFRHGQDSCNALFCDGHVETMTSNNLVLLPTNGTRPWRWW